MPAARHGQSCCQGQTHFCRALDIHVPRAAGRPVGVMWHFCVGGYTWAACSGTPGGCYVAFLRGGYTWAACSRTPGGCNVAFLRGWIRMGRVQRGAQWV
eukprot:364876-Chlamydomonas_euryale.AAC.7